MSPAAPLALTIGDPGGIGPEIALAAWGLRQKLKVPAFYLIGDPELMAKRARLVGADVPMEVVDPQLTSATFSRALPIVPLKATLLDSPGLPSTANAPGIIEAIERAVADVMDGQAGAVVTCPISKKPLYDAGFPHPGHTEFLGELGSRIAGRPLKPVMMLAGPELRAVPVTIHIPLSRVPGALTTQAIVEVATITARDLASRFGIERPRLAIAGLNPHAGEGGAMGSEDEQIIRPAMEDLRRQGIDARGPLPADTMFHVAARHTYDAAICMYHDQALIPAKALAFDETVNVTLGLPFIRTSPDHGTAFDIAGQGIARPDSLIAALTMARAMADLSTP